MIVLENTIIVVDKLLQNRKLYRQLLEQNQRYKYVIIEFASTTLALEYCKTSLPDVILINLNLHNKTGLDFLEELKQQSRKNSIPAIIVSEFVDETIVVKAMTNGAQDYLVKSKLTSEALNRACQTVIERFRLMEQIDQQQEQQRLIADITLRIHQSLSLENVLNIAVEEVRNLLKADRVLVYQFEKDMSGKVVAESVIPQWKVLLNFCCRDTYLSEQAGKEYRLGKQIVVPDIDAAGYSECHLQMLAEFQVKAKMIIPIFLSNQQLESEKHCRKANAYPLWGLLIAHQCSNPRQWRKSEVELLEQLSVQLAIAIQQAELYQNLQNLNTQLEAKVQERTAELEKSECKFRAIFEQTVQFVGLLSPDGKVLEFNQAYLEYVKAQRSDLIGLPFWDSLSCPDCQLLKKNLQIAVVEAAQGKFISSELSLANAEGKIITIDFSIKPIFDDGQVIFLLLEGRDITTRKQTEASLQQLNQSLENRVQQRTLDLEEANTSLRKEIAERQRVEDELRQAEISLTEKNALLQAIIQSAPVAVSMVDAKGNLMLWNPMAERIFGYSTTEVLNQSVWIFLETQQPPLQTFVQKTLANNPLNQVETQINCQDRCLDISLSTALVRDANDHLIGVMAIVEDITERKQAEVKMLQLQQRLEFLLMSSPGAIYTCKAQDEYAATFISENVQALFGYQSWEYTTNNKFWISRIHPEDQSLVIDKLAHIPIKEEIDLEYRFLDQMGNYHWVYDRAKLVRDDRGNPVELIGYWLDISDRKQAELDVIHHRDLREAIFNESADAIFLADNDTQLIFDCNSRAVELFEATNKQELLNITGNALQRCQFTPQEWTAIHAELNQLSFWSQEIEYITRKGNVFWGNLATKQITVAGRIINLVRVTDISEQQAARSERKKTIEQIQRSLEEKETLLKEIHHRVKNNLQIISSLLRMQSRRVDDEITSMLFQESQNRVQSMALIHEQLYQSPELSQIDFGSYIRSLTDNLFRCYGISQRKIALHIETNNIKLTLDTAIPCGLIINELVSNSLKYAFPVQQQGKITICLEQLTENQLTLIVKDTGIGIPSLLDWQNTDSLGLRIVKNLIRQIKGKIILERNQGTAFYIQFFQTFN
ncbi:MAG TPA: PAS domain S-box protein [Trichormus sp. M33_DOE_039]|nr:PAS domain S-box protein [Trichormus sp. M33_DOE_039]